MIWFEIGMLVVSTILSFVLRPKPPQPKPPALKDFDVPTADASRPIPMVFGTVLVTGPNVVWYGDATSETGGERALLSKPSQNGNPGFTPE